MSERLTDDELASERKHLTQFRAQTMTPVSVKNYASALTEIQERRAVDLTDEERSLLGFARDLMFQRASRGYHELSERALSVLDRLLHGGKP
jgi:dTDP-4-dehydrorhamnose reductase